MEAGDVYNQKKLQERLSDDEDAAVNLYQNNGYLFSRIDPIEINIENDSVDLELRVVEGPKATIKRVIIQGNDRLYEEIIRREIRTKPGRSSVKTISFVPCVKLHKRAISTLRRSSRISGRVSAPTKRMER